MSAASKTYVEKRSWFHSVQSFHRVLEWHIITYTLLMMLGFSQDLVWTVAYTLQMMSIIFLEINALGIFWMCLEIWSTYPSSTLSTASICGYVTRLCASYVILLYQALYFFWSFEVSIIPTSETTAGTPLAGDSIRSTGTQY